MAWYPYSYKTAFDPLEREIAPIGSVGEIFAVGDTDFTTPLQPYDLSGLPVELSVQGPAGYIPNFQVEGHTSVIWKSGDYIFEFTTSMPLPGPTGANVIGAADNGDGTMRFDLSNGETVGPIPIPEGPVLVDDDVAANINNPASATAAALNATYATNERVQTLAYGTNLEATDSTVATWVPDVATLTGQALAEHFAAIGPGGRQAVYKDELIFNVLDHGAVGDGAGDGTVDAAAINDAITKASEATSIHPRIVYLPYTPNGYAVTTIVMKPSVTLRGPGKLVHAQAQSYLVDFTGAPDTRVEGVTFDGNGLTGSALLRIPVANVTLTGCHFPRSATPLAAGVNGVWIRGGGTNVTVKRCRFSMADNIKVDGACQNIKVTNNVFANWSSRCLHVVGTATDTVDGLEFSSNIVRDVTTDLAEPGPRQPLAIQGVSGGWHTGVRARDNIVYGNGLPHHSGADGGALQGGLADCLSLHYCSGFTISGNQVFDSGEVGITASRNSRYGTITGNTLVRCNTTGLAIGTSADPVNAISIGDNTFVDCGLEKGVTTPRTGTQNAIYLYKANGVTIDGSVCLDTGGGTMKHLIYANSCANITLGVRVLRGMVGDLDPASEINTNLQAVTTTAL